MSRPNLGRGYILHRLIFKIHYGHFRDIRKWNEPHDAKLPAFGLMLAYDDLWKTKGRNVENTEAERLPDR